MFSSGLFITLFKIVILRVKVARDANGFDTLTIASVSRGMAGDFEIKATNDMGEAVSKCVIKVNSE